MIQRWKKAPGRDRSLYEVMNTDEIDKADPDVPDDLLISLGSQRFRVEDLGREVTVQSRVLKHDRRMIVAGRVPGASASLTLPDNSFAPRSRALEGSNAHHNTRGFASKRHTEVLGGRQVVVVVGTPQHDFGLRKSNRTSSIKVLSNQACLYYQYL